MASSDFEQKLSVIFEGGDTFTKSLTKVSNELKKFTTTLSSVASQMSNISNAMDTAGSRLEKSIQKAFFGVSKKGSVGKGSIADFINKQMVEIQSALSATNVEKTAQATQSTINKAIANINKSKNGFKKLSFTGAGFDIQMFAGGKQNSPTKDKLIKLFSQTSWLYGIDEKLIGEVYDKLSNKQMLLLSREINKKKSNVIASFMRKVIQNATMTGNEITAMGVPESRKQTKTKDTLTSKLLRSMLSDLNIDDPTALNQFRTMLKNDTINSIDKQIAELNSEKIIADAKAKIQKSKQKITNLLEKDIYKTKSGSYAKSITMNSLNATDGLSYGKQMSHLETLLKQTKKDTIELEKEQAIFEAEAKKEEAAISKIKKIKQRIDDVLERDIFSTYKGQGLKSNVMFSMSATGGLNSENKVTYFENLLKQTRKDTARLEREQATYEAEVKKEELTLKKVQKTKNRIEDILEKDIFKTYNGKVTKGNILSKLNSTSGLSADSQLSFIGDLLRQTKRDVYRLERDEAEFQTAIKKEELVLNRIQKMKFRIEDILEKDIFKTTNGKSVKGNILSKMNSSAGLSTDSQLVFIENLLRQTKRDTYRLERDEADFKAELKKEEAALKRIQKLKNKIDDIFDRDIFKTSNGMALQSNVVRMVGSASGMGLESQISYFETLLKLTKKETTKLEKDQAAFEAEAKKAIAARKRFKDTINQLNAKYADPFYSTELNKINNISATTKSAIYKTTADEVAAYKKAQEQAIQVALQADIRRGNYSRAISNKKRISSVAEQLVRAEDFNIGSDFAVLKNQIIQKYRGNVNAMTKALSDIRGNNVLRGEEAKLEKAKQKLDKELIKAATTIDVTKYKNDYDNVIRNNPGVKEQIKLINKIAEQTQFAASQAGNVAPIATTQAAVDPGLIADKYSNAFSKLFNINFGTIQDALTNGLSNAIDKLSSLFNKLAFSVVAAGAAFVAFGWQIKTFGSEIILSTEKMRGYNIGLLGMMKTQGAVNALMENSIKVTQDLPIAYDQIFASTKAFAMISPLRPMLTDSTKAEQSLEKLYGIVMALSQIEPEWGIQGAIFSLREALSGDLLSLKRRFEIPVNMITTLDGKKITDVKNNPEQMLSGLYNYLSPIYGKDALEMTSRQFGSLISKIQGYWEIFKSNIGEGGFYNVITDDLLKIRDAIGEFVNSVDGKEIAKRISDVFTSMYLSVKTSLFGISDIFNSVFGNDLVEFGSVNGLISIVEKYAKVIRGIGEYINSSDAQQIMTSLWDNLKVGSNEAIKAAEDFYKSFTSGYSDAKSVIIDLYNSVMDLYNNIVGIFGRENTIKGIIFVWLFGIGNVKDLIASTFGLVVNAGQGLSGTLANITQKSLPSLSDKFKALATGSMLSFSIQLGVILAGFASLYVLLKRFDNYSPSGWLANLFGYDEKGKNDTWLRKVDSLKSTLNLVKENSTDKNIQALSINSNDLQSRDSANLWLEKNNNTIRKLESDTKAKLQSIGAIYDDASLKKFQAGNYPTFDWTRMFEVSSLKMTLMNIQELRNSIEEVAKFGESIDQSKVADEFNKVAKASEESESGILGFFDNVFGGIKDKAIEATERAKDLTVSIESMRESLDSLKKSNNGVDLLGVTDETIRGGYILEKQFKDILGYQLKITSGKDIRPENKNSKHPSGQALDFSIKDIDIETIYNQDFLNRLAAVAKENKITDIIFENSVKSGDNKFKEKILQPMINEANKAIGQELLQVKTNSAASASHIHMNLDGDIKPAKDMISAIGDTIDDVYSLYDGLKSSVTTSLGGNIPHFFDPRDIIAKSKIIADQSEKEIKSASSGFYGVITDNRNKFIQSVLQSNAEKLITELNTGDSRFGSAEVEQIMDTYNSKKSTLQGQNLNKWYESAIRTKLYESAGILTTFTGPILNDKTIGELETFADYFGVSISNIKMARDNMQRSITKQLSELSTTKDTELVAASNRFKNIMMEQLSKNTYQFFPNIQANLDTMIQKNAINEAKDFVMAYAPITDKTSIVNALNEIAVDIMSGGNIDEAINRLKNFSDMLLKITDQVNGKNNIGALVAGGGVGGFIGSIIPTEVMNIGNNVPGVVKYINSLIDVLKKSKDAVGSNSAIIKFNAAIELFKKNLTDKSISQLKAMKNEMAGLNREAKGAWFSAMQGRLEMEPQALGDSFALGIEKAVSEWKNFSEIMMEEGANLVNSMTSAFETGFFDFMTMKIHNLGDMFKQIGVSIRDEIVKIIAKMLALQTMKIVLGIDVNAQGQSSFTGGGLLGGLFKSFVPSLFNNKANTTGNSTPYIAGDMMSNFISGGKGNNAVVSSMLMAGGMPIGASGAGSSFLSSGVSNLASGAIFNMGSKALTGAKLLGKGGTLSKAWGGLKAFNAANPWVLPAAAAISFLSQPGRLFGGTKDKTGAAQAAYASANEERDAYIKRRIDDASGYNMSSRFGDIAKYEFGGISYRTWKSGDGWFKGPKEKHAASDATAFYDSMKQYYQLLNSAAKEHYDTTRHINKLKETNELASLQLEKSVKVRYYNQIKDIYNTALAENDKETIDKFRDKFYESANEIADIADAIAENLHNTAVSEARYRNALAGNSDIGSKQIDINEQQYKLSKLTRGTLEWYDAQTEYINSSRELASMLRNQIESAKKAYNSSYLAIYSNKNLAYGTSGYYTYGNATTKVNPYLTDMGLTDSAKLAKYGTTSSKYAVDINYGLKAANGVYGYSSMTGTQTVSYDDYMKLSNNGLIGLVSTTGGSYKDAILDEIIGETFANGAIYSGKITATPKIETFYNETIEEINTRIEELITHANNEVNVMGLKNEYKYRMENLFTNEFDKTWDQYLLIFKQRDQLEVTFRNRFSNYTDPASQLKGADLELYDALKEAIANVNLEIANIYEDVASQIDSWINSGFVGSSIKKVLTTMPLELMESYFKNIDDFVKKQQYRLDAFSTLKDLDSVDFSNVLNSIKNMSGIGYTTNAYGIQSPTAIGALYTDMLGSLSTSGDPWQAWYNFQMNTVKTKITNLEAGTDEWYSAQMELLNLQMEQQQHIKEKTQDVNDAWLDMLESIDKTLQMRIAEERNTAKGDTVFIDMRNINNEEAKNIANQIRDLIAKNDPNAATLIEALKKKLLGIMK